MFSFEYLYKKKSVDKQDWWM